MKKQSNGLIEVHVLIERQQYDKLVLLGVIHPNRKRSGISRAVNQGLQFVIDNEVTWGNHCRKVKAK